MTSSSIFKMVLFLVILAIALEHENAFSQAAAGIKKGSRTMYKYLHQPNTFMGESIHPAWWKRGQSDVDLEDVPQMNLPEEQESRGGCSFRDYWRVGQHVCIPYACLRTLDEGSGDRDIQFRKLDYDCICLLPGVGCKTLE